VASPQDVNVEVLIRQVAHVETFSPSKERATRIHVYLTNLGPLRIPHSEHRVPQFRTSHSPGALNSDIIQDRHGRPFKYPLFLVLGNVQSFYG
jgi:hypothetical protein